MRDLTTTRRWDIEKIEIMCHKILNLVIVFWKPLHQSGKMLYHEFFILHKANRVVFCL